ncbi:MAG TPA: aldose epimerase family protein [Gemmatimonadales bacterium]|nr:aldose epimerase family protein [Gemmatimonadales bacterium]
MPPVISRAEFGRTPSGEPVDLFAISVGDGLTLRATNYGGIITALSVPDRHARTGSVVLGFDTLLPYLENPCYLGAIVGRSAGRIAGATFLLDGKRYHLNANAGRHHLHGGAQGFDQAVWRAEAFRDAQKAGLVLSHTSPDGDQGYPGSLQTTAQYTLTGRLELEVLFQAVTDHPTLVNLVQHSYFNLAGHGTTILSHELQINADRYTPIDADLIPTGRIEAVAETPLDFRKPTAIGDRIDQANAQLRRGAGYDHNFVLNRAGEGLAHAAHLTAPTSGRSLDVYTTEPGLQLYTGNFLEPSRTAGAFGARTGVCLEAQHFPDAPNHPAFPSIVLRPGLTYLSRTVFRFDLSR